MFPPFPTEQASKYILELFQALDSGILKLQQLGKESLERKGHGLMIGAIVCKTQENKNLILIAVSGISLELYCPQNNFSFSDNTDYIIVPPIVNQEDIYKALLKNDLEIHELTDKINSLDKNIHKDLLTELKNKRTKLTSESLENVFGLYNFTCFNGKKISLKQIIANKKTLPPTGTGDCCAPKLLSYAFSHKLQIISMDEIFYGKNTKNKTHKQSYGPCNERCGFILPEILGLNILYRDEDIIVVNKQSGVLSVPGRGEDKFDSIETRLRILFPNCIQQPSVHRLDMETSGIMILAFNKEAQKNLQKQFSETQIHKKYAALLDGILEKAEGNLAPKNGEKSGEIALKFRLDVDNRPHQIYDEEFGKLGITYWENAGIVVYKNPENNISKKVTKIIFSPKTGRTHQLRLASSSNYGFGLPIIGDTLYGNCLPGQRLMLHSFYIEFFHPITGEKMIFNCPEDF